MREQRQLQVFAEDLGRNADRQSLPVELFDQGCAASAAGRIQEPAFAGKLAQPPRFTIALFRRTGRSNDDNLLCAESNTRQTLRNRVGLGQQADRTIEGTAAHLLDEIGGPVRADLELDARERPPQDIERRREDDLAQAMRDSRFQIAARIGRGSESLLMAERDWTTIQQLNPNMPPPLLTSRGTGPEGDAAIVLVRFEGL